MYWFFDIDADGNASFKLGLNKQVLLDVARTCNLDGTNVYFTLYVSSMLSK